MTETKIVWTAHYKGIVKIFSPRLSDHFHTVHLACMGHLLQTKEKQNKGRIKPVAKKTKQKKKMEMKKSIIQKDYWLYNYQAFWFGSKPQRKKPNRLTTADDYGTGGTKDVTQTGHPIMCSHNPLGSSSKAWNVSEFLYFFYLQKLLILFIFACMQSVGTLQSKSKCCIHCVH